MNLSIGDRALSSRNADRFCLLPPGDLSSHPPSLYERNLIQLWEGLAGWLCVFGAGGNFLLLLVLMNFPKLRSGAGFLVMILLTDYLVLCAILVPPSIYPAPNFRQIWPRSGEILHILPHEI
ncbi:hypothetical protein BV898_18063 [Hypsibius exemplaris]|uniref:G-protein coupled receptors family 1 profile domain-containing protein n=1 Tax=Hypsibius exemplaris TaxID=2072580 RepID=A0A9X6NGN8_HYPEX|nr:hypothetical protein BV898_18063 [Hypsibius exemplaris]